MNDQHKTSNSIKKLQLYDKASKKFVEHWYLDSEGFLWIDTDQYGVDMSGKREIRPANLDRYVLIEDGCVLIENTNLNNKKQ